MQATQQSVSPPAVGELAPDFTLTDSDGTPWRLEQQTAAGRVLLLFYRGQW